MTDLTPRRLHPALAAVAAVALAAGASACGGSTARHPSSSPATSTSQAPTPVSSTTSAPTTAATAPTTTAAAPTTAPATTSPSPSSGSSPAGSTPAGTAPANPGSPVDSAIKVYSDCKSTSVEPAGIVLSCGDYGESLSALKWDTWTAARATGVGTLIYNDCNPNCAAGHQHSVPGTHVTLTGPVAGRGNQTVWSKIHLSPAPPGLPADQTLPTSPV